MRLCLSILVELGDTIILGILPRSVIELATRRGFVKAYRDHITRDVYIYLGALDPLVSTIRVARQSYLNRGANRKFPPIGKFRCLLQPFQGGTLLLIKPIQYSKKRKDFVPSQLNEGTLVITQLLDLSNPINRSKL